MIALKRDKPKKCLDCPCLWTLGDIISTTDNKKYAARFCAAAHKEICVYEELEDMPLPDSWMKFSIPDWCPWIELPNYNACVNIDDEEERRWHLSMAGLGGSYDL